MFRVSPIPIFRMAPMGGGGNIELGTTIASGGTTGSILFIGAAAVITQDNANLFWDDTNNRLGLGTASPTGQLHLAGDRSQAAWGLTGLQIQVAAGTFTDTSTAAAGTATNAAISSIAQHTLAASNTITTTNAYGFYIGGAPISGSNQTLVSTYAFYIASTASVDGAGGTPTSAYGLYAVTPTGATTNWAAVFDGGSISIGSAATTGNHAIKFNETGLNQLMISNHGGGIQINAQECIVMAIDSNANNTTGRFTVVNNTATLQATTASTPSNELFRVQENGRVGIGTSTPSALLDVNGTIVPTTNDIGALGTSSLAFSDLFLASGGVIDLASGGVTLTHDATNDGVTVASGALQLSNNIGSLNGVADMVRLGAFDLSAGNATLALATETAVATEALGDSTHTLTVRINGTSYKMMLVSV